VGLHNLGLKNDGNAQVGVLVAIGPRPAATNREIAQVGPRLYHGHRTIGLCRCYHIQARMDTVACCLVPGTIVNRGTTYCRLQQQKHGNG